MVLVKIEKNDRQTELEMAVNTCVAFATKKKLYLALMSEGLWYPRKQWAAEITCFDDTKVPPQPQRSPLASSRATIQGYLLIYNDKIVYFVKKLMRRKEILRDQRVCLQWFFLFFQFHTCKLENRELWNRQLNGSSHFNKKKGKIHILKHRINNSL